MKFQNSPIAPFKITIHKYNYGIFFLFYLFALNILYFNLALCTPVIIFRVYLTPTKQKGKISWENLKKHTFIHT